MTTFDARSAATQPRAQFRLPDPPERELDEVTALDHIYHRGMSDYLAHHLGNRETTLITADRWIVATPTDNRARARRPDLLIAFNVSPTLYRENNGYISSEQGKPPDFVLEVASESTGETDTGEKRDDYATLGITEYWRFDETGEHHKTKLAGDTLVDAAYLPVSIEELPGGALRGYSAVLNLILEWRDGLLNWVDPETGGHIATFETEREARLQAQQAQADAEQRAASAEAQLRELQAELLRRDQEVRPPTDPP